MALNFTQIFNGLRLKAKAILTSDTAGEFETSSSDSKTYLSNGTTRSPLVTEAQTATLTNKTISGSSNTLTNITATTNANLTGPVTSVGNATSISNSVITSAMIVDGTIVDADISATAAISRSKLASGTNNALVNNNSSGVLSESTDITLGTNSLTLANTKHLELQAQTDSTTTGSNASLAAFTAGGVRVTNASLVSLANIPAGAAGQEFIFFNRTGASVIIVDSSGAVGTAANRILTGAGANITLPADSALIFSYDITTARWQVVGGSGSGSGVATSAVDTVFNINDFTDPTKQINFDAGGTTGTKTTIAASQTANRTVTLPNVSGTLISSADTGTVTSTMILDGTIVDADINAAAAITRSKTASGTNYRILANNASGVMSENAAITASSAVASDTNGQLVASATSATELGYVSGTRSAIQPQLDAKTGINYISNYGAEVNTTGWATYSNTAGTAPVTGTGGSPVTTYTRTTSSPLRGTASFLLTKDAANRQGEGASYDFTIDASDQGKVLQASFEYQIASGTFADNDLSVWIYDKTNSVLIQPAPYLIKNSGIIEKFPVEFQTAINSTSYRLIVHVSSTSASAYTVKFDNFNLGPQAKLYGSAVTDWITTRVFTASAGFGTTTLSTFASKQIGDTMEVQGYFKLGTAAGTEANITLPNSIDSSKFTSTTGVTRIGTWTRIRTSATPAAISSSNDEGPIFYDGSTSNKVYFALNDNSNILQKANVTDILTTSDGLSMLFRYPITGVSSSQVFSADADTRVVDMMAGITTGSTTANTTLGGWTTVVKDTHGAFTASTGVYKVVVPGDYFVQVSLRGTSGTGHRIRVFKNGSLFCDGNAADSTYFSSSASGMIANCVAGDLITVQDDSNITIASVSSNVFSLYRIAGPAQITASESVNARYLNTAGTTISALAQLTFPTKDYDTHNAYASGNYTVPTSGKYDVFARISLTPSLTTSQSVNLELHKNGSFFSEIGSSPGIGTGTGQEYRVLGIDSVSCIAGDVLSIYASSSVSATLDTTSGWNYLIFKRVGN